MMAAPPTVPKRYDAFICHASEDKKLVAAPLAETLIALGCKVWYDEFSLKVGDSLSESIDRGLNDSRYGIVILSSSFFKKSWPKRELRGLVTNEVNGTAAILPLWHDVQREDVRNFSPTLADAFATSTTNKSIRENAIEFVKVIKPALFASYQRLWAVTSLQKSATVSIDPRRIHTGPLRRNTLSTRLLVRIQLVCEVLSKVIPLSFNDLVDGFKRDLHPASEVAIWERLAASYLKLTDGEADEKLKQQIAVALLLITLGTESAEITRSTRLPGDLVKTIESVYTNLIPLEQASEGQPNDKAFGEFADDM